MDVVCIYIGWYGSCHGDTQFGALSVSDSVSVGVSVSVSVSVVVIWMDGWMLSW